MFIRALLTHYKWDQTRLITEYFELGQDLFLEQAKVINPLKLFECLPMSNAIDDSKVCKICYDDSCEVSLYINVMRIFLIADECVQCLGSVRFGLWSQILP